MNLFSFLLALFFLISLSVKANADEQNHFPVTVEDSIEMSVLTDPDPYTPLPGADEVNYSPDRTKFLSVTRRGNLNAETNIYTLQIWHMDAVKRLFSDDGPAPTPTTVAEFASTSNFPGITRARWLDDNRTVAFLGVNHSGVAQVYTVDIRSKRLIELTNHPTSIVNFALDRKSGALIYSAFKPRAWANDEKNGVVIGRRSFFQFMRNDGDSEFSQVGYFVQHPNSDARPIEGLPATSKSLAAYLDFYISPGGRWATTVLSAPVNKDEWWTEYESVSKISYLAGADAPENRTFIGAHPFAFLQHALVDLSRAEGRPLVDAPAGLLFAGNDAHSYWLGPDTVVVVNTFLPIAQEGLSDLQLQSRRSSTFVIEVNALSGTYLPIKKIKGSILDSQLLDDRTLVVQEASAKGVTSSSFTRLNGEWVAVATRESEPSEDISVVISQGLNSAPELLARDAESDKTAILTEFNAQFDAINLGAVEIFEWTTPLGDKVTGGLIKPHNFIEGERYPLVLQTHGFSPDKFLMDGPWNSASGYAARALAASGIVVLQVPDQQTDIGFKGEKEANVSMFIAAVDKLDSLGVIDSAKVGIHGFSRTGFDVQHAITFFPDRWTAASVSDANWLSQFSYSMHFGLGYPGMIEIERLIGATLEDDENARSWAEQDPFMKAYQIETPLKIESYGSSGPYGWWDTYALLRRQGKPAEYIYYPYGTHNLVRVGERKKSQQTAVDWYRFWLLGEEDPNLEKVEQYRRWKEMRVNHCNNVRDSDRDEHGAQYSFCH